jgi:hypothetical protein
VALLLLLLLMLLLDVLGFLHALGKLRAYFPLLTT